MPITSALATEDVSCLEIAAEEVSAVNTVRGWQLHKILTIQMILVQVVAVSVIPTVSLQNIAEAWTS